MSGLGFLFVQRRADGALATLMAREEDEDEDGAVPFVASTAVSDRMGDVVFQRWNLDPFQANPVALFQHDHARPVGRVVRPHVQGLEPAARLRASILFDEDPSLPDAWVGGAVRRKTLGAVSVGFLPGGVESRALLKKTDPFYVAGEPWQVGMVFGRIGAPNELLELSVVSVPANSDALAAGVPVAGSGSGQVRGSWEVWRRDLLEVARRDMAAEERRLRSESPRSAEELAEYRANFIRLLAEQAASPAGPLDHLFRRA